MNRPSLLLRRIDPLRNVARFYELTISPTLFGDVAVTRRWGRIGTSGREIVELHARADRAHAAFDRLAAQKSRRGYVAADP